MQWFFRIFPNPMKKDFALKQEDFDALLGWLSANRDEAGVAYEKIREGLIRYFRFRGCADPHALADETINRVALKVSTFDSSKNVKTITYFYGFASNIFLEYSRNARKREVSWESEDFPVPLTFKMPDDSTDAECGCLEDCLTKLPQDESALVVEYYGKDKSEKFELRRKLAEERNMKMPALHTRVFRIRSVLRHCIEECLAKNSL
jgi:DNA-directed RNA polymerase specialized sigma24 family protein